MFYKHTSCFPTYLFIPKHSKKEKQRETENRKSGEEKETSRGKENRRRQMVQQYTAKYVKPLTVVTASLVAAA